MAGFMYGFGIMNASKTKIEIIAFGTFVSWTVNDLYRPGDGMSVTYFFLITKQKRREEVMIQMWAGYLGRTML